MVGPPIPKLKSWTAGHQAGRRARTANPSQAEDLFAKSPVSFERRFLMFDFDAGKLIIAGIVALIVIGPKELPRVMFQVGQAAAKMTRMAAEFRSQPCTKPKSTTSNPIWKGLRKARRPTLG